MALLGYVAFWAWNATASNPTSMPLGPRTLIFAGLMLAMGLLTSWLATHCWNEASQRLPTALAGQLIVFETLAALLYAYLLRGDPVQPLTLAGVALLVAGVVVALRIRPQPPSGAAAA
jgi:drug/metabolite transporter (DMT)-like permease